MINRQYNQLLLKMTRIVLEKQQRHMKDNNEIRR